MLNNKGQGGSGNKRLEKIAQGFMVSRIFLSAVELGVFNKINDAELSSVQVAESLGYDERAVEILLNALAAFGLLIKKENRFNNTDEIKAFVGQGGADNISGFFRHMIHQWDCWSDLTDVVKSGEMKPGERSGEKSRGLADAMRLSRGGFCNRLAEILDFRNIGRLLDLGGGSGDCAITLLRSRPQLSAVVFDRDPEVLSMAAKEIAGAELKNRIELVQGDFLHDDIGNPYDLVLMSHVVSVLGKNENIRLLQRAATSLDKGGSIVIWEPLLDESGTKPVHTALFAVKLLVNTISGRAYSLNELIDMLKEAGFANINHFPYSGSHIVIGRLDRNGSAE